MRLFSRPSPERDAAKAEQWVAVEQHRAYRKALNQNGERERKRGVDDETGTYHQLNSAVIDAERDVPWWRR